MRPVQHGLASAERIEALVATTLALLADEAAACLALIRLGHRQAEVNVLFTQALECLVRLAADVVEAVVGDLHDGLPTSSPTGTYSFTTNQEAVLNVTQAAT